MPCTQGHSALEQPPLGWAQPDTLVLINSNNLLGGLGLGVLLLLTPSSFQMLRLLRPNQLPHRKVEPRSAATAMFGPH